MASSAPRQRVIDDTDPAIQYGPNGWFVADPTSLNVGNFGPIYQETSHATTSKNSSLSFPFNGTAIRVFGTIMVTTDPATNTTDPTWECFVDEIPISNPQPTFPYPENNWILCDQPHIAPGAHALTVKVQSRGRAFYLDSLVYTPLPDDAPAASAVLIYPNTDPAVSYGSGWGKLGGENATNVKDAQVALNFHGTSASLYGFVPTEAAHNATWGTYSIDGDTPVNFTLQGLPPSPNTATNYNVPLFTTPTVPNAEHNLVVTYGGDAQHTPLVVEAFYVATAAASAPNSNSNSSSSTSGASSPSSSAAPGKHTTSVGAIVGGLLGAIALLLLLAVLALVCMRRRRRAAAEADSTSAEPYPYPMSLPVPVPMAEAPPISHPTTYGHAPDTRARALPPLPASGARSPTEGGAQASTHASSSSESAYSPHDHDAQSRSRSSITYPSVLHQVASPSSGLGHPQSEDPDSTGSSSSYYGASLPSSQRRYQLPHRDEGSTTSAVGSHGSVHAALPAPSNPTPSTRAREPRYDDYRDSAYGAHTLPSPASSTPPRLPLPRPPLPIPNSTNPTSTSTNANAPSATAPSPTSTSRAPRETSKLARERAAAAAYATPAPPLTLLGPNANANDVRVLRHEDSGLRRLQIPGSVVELEMPPGYSPT
ncbi:hypothetical protein C8R46DRAFT_955439 [Mycena filopes]|nr:hypothetical protein C8R46DRAFT_955439 [Mycena filopes]